MAESTPKSYSTDPNLWLYTSLTAGSSHIFTATSRLETILKANRIPFKALDVATDEKARMLWGRRAAGKKLPGLMRMGELVGDLEEIEEWNEFGELKQRLNFSKTPISSAQSTPSKAPVAAAPQTTSATSTTQSTPKLGAVATSEPAPRPPPAGAVPTAFTIAMKAAGAEAAAKAIQNKAGGAGKPLVGKGTKDETAVTKNADEKLSDSAGIPPPVKIAEASEAKAETEENAPVTAPAPTAPTAAAAAAAASPFEGETEALQTKEEEFTKAKEEKVTGIAPSSAAVPIPAVAEEKEEEEKKKESQTAVQSTESLPTPLTPEKDTPSLPHRNSNVEAASEEEIKNVEASNAIPEEKQEEEAEEEEEEEVKDTAKHEVVEESSEHEITGEGKGEKTQEEPVKHGAAKSEGTEEAQEKPAGHEVTEEDDVKKTQEQPAATGDLAGESVTD